MYIHKYAYEIILEQIHLFVSKIIKINYSNSSHTCELLQFTYGAQFVFQVRTFYVSQRWSIHKI